MNDLMSRTATAALVPNLSPNPSRSAPLPFWTGLAAACVATLLPLAWLVPVQADMIIDFESSTLPTTGYINQASGGRHIVDGVGFSNKYNATYGSWNGFALSNHTNTTTPGYSNQYSSYSPGTPLHGGAGNSNNYMVAFGYRDAPSNGTFSAAQLISLPSIYLPEGIRALSVSLANTTYAALSMLNGDSFAKKFGGTSGTELDFFTLSIYGIDAFGSVLDNTLEIKLADFTSPDSANDYVQSQWKEFQLTGMEDAKSLHFNLTSSDVGAWGMNTPAYFAMDNLVVTAVPEPSSMLLCGTALAGLLAYGRKRLQRNDSKVPAVDALSGSAV